MTKVVKVPILLIKLCELDAGEAFLFSGELFIKLCNIEENLATALSVHKDYVEQCSNSLLVTPVKLTEVHYKEL